VALLPLGICGVGLAIVDSCAQIAQLAHQTARFFS
jgi:hypothetical protein